MRIAEIAPLAESVPPKFYGGTERVVSYLTEELVRLGHEVTLFASGDSRSGARLVAPCERGLRLAGLETTSLLHHLIMLEQLRRMLRCFDAVHFHTDSLHFPLAHCMPVPHLSTLHGRLDEPATLALYEQLDDLPLVSISDAQRGTLSRCNWAGTIYHGLPKDLYPVGTGEGGYLVFVGRISPEKRIDRAVAIAEQAGLPLLIAAKRNESEKAYVKTVEGYLSSPGVTFLGEVGERDKGELLGQARALLFPIDWPEPFGLVMVEAMFCGTPVIAWRRGAVPEIVESGTTGYIVDSIEEAVAAVKAVGSIDRLRCAEAARARFSVERMAHQYVALLERQCQYGRASSAA